MDFTLSLYKTLLKTLIERGYSFITFKDYLISRNNRNDNQVVILRHDIDHIPENSVRTAEIENLIGIRGTYYFRIIPNIYKIKIIEKVASLGHEIGYHYEDVDLIRKNQKLRVKSEKDKDALIDLAYKSFFRNLQFIRNDYSIDTICAHGSPLSPYSNKIIWKKYDYKKLGIIGDAGTDIDWNEFAYFTDTGRRWNGANVSVRDKVTSKYNFNFRSTQDIIKNSGNLPDKIVITIHTHRWFNPGAMWLNELVFQNIKNIAKYYIVKRNKEEHT